MSAAPPLRIAMWSGPRNISTAMMRSWGNRPDTFVCDEPLYAHYLTRVEVDHPGVDEVMRHHETDWRKVVAWLTGPVPEGRAIFYQKHMAHHLLPEIDLAWLDEMANAFLIRDPREMLPSLGEHMARPSLTDTGLPQQLEIFERVRAAAGGVPPVIDARDVLERPEPLLRRLCDALGVPFLPQMLHWPPGRRDTDGVWARHWYAAVENSTGFRPYRAKSAPLAEHLTQLYENCLPLYRELHRWRLRVRDDGASADQTAS